MNAMGHNVKTFIGVRQRDLTRAIRAIASPDYMAMGSQGMAEMGDMEMPLPDNTLPMMTGFGQFGPIEMGGMFTVVKVTRASPPAITRIRAGTRIRPAPWPTKSKMSRRSKRHGARNGPARARRSSSTS
jgi:hypothetical protein